MQVTKQKLAVLLKDAKKAHHQFVQENNIEEDNEWAQWYAEYIHDEVTNSSS